MAFPWHAISLLIATTHGHLRTDTVSAWTQCAKVHIIYSAWLDPQGNYKSTMKENMERLALGFSGTRLSFRLTAELSGGTINESTFAKNVVQEKFPSASVHWNETNHYEYSGVHRVWDIGQSDFVSAECLESAFVLYLHNRGDTPGNQLSTTDRTLFDTLVLDPFHILRIFDANPNVTLVALSIAPGAFPWFNFYWARLSFIRTLPEPVISNNRWYYEDWTGRFGSCYGWTDQCSPGGYTNTYGKVEFDEKSEHPQRRCAGSRPKDCEAYDSLRLAHMFSILDNSTGVARSSTQAVTLIETLATATPLVGRFPTLDAPATSARVRDPAHVPCDDILLGFSPGHVGTTTLSQRSNYASGATPLQSVAFFFESVRRFGKKVARPWFFATPNEEAKFVRERLVPAMKEEIKQQRAEGTLDGADEPVRKCVDVSHFNVVYFRGLIQELRASSTPFRFVRIRRDALEVAQSLGTVTGGPRGSIWGHKEDHINLYAGFHPIRNPNAVLRLSSTAWAKLSALQQALWVNDETEAQWLTNVDAATRSAALEVAWKKRDEDGDPLRDRCAVPIAGALGLEAVPSPSNEGEHVNTTETRKHGNTTEAELREAMHELAEYRAKMEAACPPFVRLAAKLPSATAYGARAARLRSYNSSQPAS